MRAGLLLTLAAGCIGDVDMQVDNAGRVCARGQPNPGDFEAGNAVFIDYALVTRCFSYSCDVDRIATCEVTQRGSTLDITSSARWVDIRRRENSVCTLDCGHLAGTCSSPPLAAGDYTVTFGEQSFALSIPTFLVDRPCLER